MITAVFIVSLIYWIYLYFHTSMVIVFDAVAYEQLGRMLHEQGWLSYFKTGPNREPLFPLSIAFSIGIADFFHVHYQKIQLAVQLLVLAGSQVLLWRLLIRFNIQPVIMAVILLYWAFSPAIVNSALSLFSEVMAYPFVLLLILSSFNILAPMTNNKKLRYLLSGIIWGCAALALVMVKAVSVYMLMVAGGWIFIVLLWRWIRGSQREPTVIVALVIGCVLLQSGVIVYQSFNKRYNGYSVVTDRGPWMLYGNITRRVQPHDVNSLKAALALVPGEGVCRLVAKPEDCRYWQFMTSDGFGSQRLRALSESGYSTDQINSALIHETKEFIVAHPVPVVFFGLLEGLKMFFWESTQIGFVTYPAWLNHIYEHGIFKSFLRLIVAIITIIAFGSVAFISVRSKNYQQFLLLLMAVTFIFLYSWVTVLTRYAFPMIPVYLLMIACSLNSWLIKRK